MKKVSIILKDKDILHLNLITSIFIEKDKDKSKHGRQHSLDGKWAKKKFTELFKTSTKNVVAKLNPDENYKSTNGLDDFLKELSLEQYEKTFLDAGFDGPDALDIMKNMTDDDLKEIGIYKLGHRRKLLNAFNQSQTRIRTEDEVRAFISKIGKDLGFRTVSQLKDINPVLIFQYPGGKEILQQYNNSYTELLISGIVHLFVLHIFNSYISYLFFVNF